MPCGNVPFGVVHYEVSVTKSKLSKRRSRIVSDTYDPNRGEQKARPRKPPILGQAHGLSDEEGAMIQQMIREEQHSSRALYIPEKDLDAQATTQMSPEVAQVIEDSKLR